MNTPDPSMEIALKQYLDCGTTLESAVEGLREVDLDQRADEGWSIRQMVHHIADGDDIWKNCILLILGKPDTEFDLSWYWSIPQENWADFWGYSSRDIHGSLARFRANREMIVDLLRIRPETWRSSAIIHWPRDSQASRISIEDVVEMQTRHPRGHCSEILNIRQVYGLAQSSYRDRPTLRE